MKSVSISKLKNFKHCPLSYLYTYVDKFSPVEKQPIWVQSKGLVLHQVFEDLLKYENYKDSETPGLPYRVASQEVVLEAFKKAMQENDMPIEKAIEFNLKLGLKRWLSFKHDYLDKTEHVMHAEKQYNEVLFGDTKTITILDLLEDCGDGNYIIYDYKTPKSVDVSRYKDQLLLYAYTVACIKGVIKPGSEDYEKVAEHFRVFVFFPLVTGNFETYEKCLKEVSFTAEDVADVMHDIVKTCDVIDGFDFSRPAEVLQLSCPDFQCKWCTFCGSKAQFELKSKSGRPFEGCPITAFMGMEAVASEFQAV